MEETQTERELELVNAVASKSYPRIVAAIQRSPWAILPEKFEEISGFLQAKIRGDEVDEAKIVSALSNRQFKEPSTTNLIGVLPLVGTIAQRGSQLRSSGITSADRFGEYFDAMVKDPDVSHIVIDVDSPGGSVFGVAELAEKIFNARGKKPITAVANSLMASAAYWIGAAADEIVVSPGSQIGSIGVFTSHIDVSEWEKNLGIKTTLISAGKHKVEGNPYEPLSEEARAAIQSNVDEYYETFVSAVAKFRGVSIGDVKNGFGQGRVVGAQESVSTGLADRVETLEQTLGRVGIRSDGAVTHETYNVSLLDKEVTIYELETERRANNG